MIIFMHTLAKNVTEQQEDLSLLWLGRQLMQVAPLKADWRVKSTNVRLKAMVQYEKQQEAYSGVRSISEFVHSCTVFNTVTPIPPFTLEALLLRKRLKGYLIAYVLKKRCYSI
jgi:hypothetical protein